MMYLGNAFSLNMLAELPAQVEVREVPIEWVALSDPRSVVGHADTAAVFTSVLGFEVKCNRETISLKSGDEMVVGQYLGPRLPEGATELPKWATIKWLVVKVY